MIAPQVEVTGTVQPDGTLHLDRKLDLPPGPVRVVVQATAPAAREDWWQYLQRTRQDLEAQGYSTLTAEEVTAHIEWLRGDDDRLDAADPQLESEAQPQGR